MSDEIIGYAIRIARGIEISAETLALDVIDEVGPRGEFITSEHTNEHFRKELWIPSLIDKNRYDVWVA